LSYGASTYERVVLFRFDRNTESVGKDDLGKVARFQAAINASKDASGKPDPYAAAGIDYITLSVLYSGTFQAESKG